MRTSSSIRNQRSYQKACERRARLDAHALGIVKKRILRYIDNTLHKIMGAKSRDELVYLLANEQSITARLRLPRQSSLTYCELVSNALKELTQSKKLQYHDDGEDVVVGMPNTWPPHELQSSAVTIEDLDPEFDWASLADTRCSPKIWRELVIAH